MEGAGNSGMRKYIEMCIQVPCWIHILYPIRAHVKKLTMVVQELQRENQRLGAELAKQTKLVAVNEAHAREAEVAALHGVIQKLQVWTWREAAATVASQEMLAAEMPSGIAAMAFATMCMPS